MIIGYLLLLGGIGQLAAGLLTEVPALTVVGGVWSLAGIVNIASSHLARSRAQARTGTASSINSDDLTDPIARARRYRSTGGAPGRGILALACAAAAIGVGVWAPGFDSATSITALPWRIPMIVAGAILGFLCLVGLLVYASASRMRSAVIPATVAILGMKETALHDSSQLPYIRFVLGVYGEGLPYYEATVQQPVPFLSIPKLAVGAQFSAMVAGPAKPDNVIVDWREPITSAPIRPATAAVSGSAVPAAAPAAGDPAARLRELDSLQQQGLISPDEFQQQRSRILDGI